MCGIAGFCIAPNEHVNARRLAAGLLMGIEPRGKDATGIAWRTASGAVTVRKKDVNATDFLRGGYMPMSKRVTTAIMHTRLWTRGAPTNNNNNHPITVKNIVGVHNGMVWNDDDLFFNMGLHHERIADVDSEAIFAAIARGREKFVTRAGAEMDYPRLAGTKTTADVLEYIDGSAAIAWLDTDDTNPDTLHLARLYQSPLVWGQTAGGSLLFASTLEAVELGATAAKLKLVHHENMDEGEYYVVRNGRVEECQKFESSSGNWWGKYSGNNTTVGKAVSKLSNFDRDAWGDELTEDGHTNAEVNGTDWEWSEGDAFTTTRTRDESGWVRTWDPQRSLSKVEAEEYQEDYSQRELAIEDYLDGLKVPTPEWWDAACGLHAYVRPGDWVLTNVAGQRVYGQLWDLPRSFPHGEYTVRCLVPVSHRRPSKLEVVMVTRFHDEFDEVSSKANTNAGAVRQLVSVESEGGEL